MAGGRRWATDRQGPERWAEDEVGAERQTLTELMTAANESEAAIVRATLQAEGIPTWQFAAGTALLGASGASGMNPATIQVRTHDMERAREALDRVREDSVELDWNEVDVGQPEDALAARIAQGEFGDGPSRWQGALPRALVWIAIVAALLLLTGPLGALIGLIFAGVDLLRRLRLGLKYSRQLEE